MNMIGLIENGFKSYWFTPSKSSARSLHGEERKQKYYDWFLGKRKESDWFAGKSGSNITGSRRRNILPTRCVGERGTNLIGLLKSGINLIGLRRRRFPPARFVGEKRAEIL